MPDTAANYLSKDKFEELTQELEHLKTVRRREIAEQLEYARSLGDLSENAEYEEARNLQAATEDRIRVIEEQMERCVAWIERNDSKARGEGGARV